MRLISIFVAVMLAAALVVACGDDDDETLSKSEYVRQGNVICAEWARDFRKLFEKDFPTTQSAIPKFFGAATPIFEKRMRRLRALEAPEGDENRVEAFLAEGDKATAQFGRARTDPKVASQIFQAEGGKNEKAFAKQARAYGLSECEEEEEEEDKEEKATVDPSKFPAEKRAFIEKIDARCRESERKIKPLEARYLKKFPPPVTAWAEFLPRLVSVIRADVEFARNLTPPTADKAKIDGLVERQGALVDKLDQAGKAAQAGDEKTVSRLTQEAFSESEKVDAGLRKYGFQVCGNQDEGDEGDEDEGDKEKK